MFDDVPVPVLLLFIVALTAVAPARYVFDFIAYSPANQDITQPPEDLDWRTTEKLWRNLALLAGLAAFAVFVFTPAAAQFTRSTMFVPLLLGSFGLVSFATVARGLKAGTIEPLLRGWRTSYTRATQPKRFWAALGWNAVLGCGLLVLSPLSLSQGHRDRCHDWNGTRSPQERLDACTTLIQKNGGGPESADWFAQRGIAYYNLQDYESAKADYSRAIALDPQDSYSLFNRGLTHQQTGDQRDAIADFSASIRLRPDNAGAYFQRGVLLLDMGEFGEAAADLTQAHEFDPNDPWTLANRGLAHAWNNDRQRAERDFDAVQVLDPSNQVMLRGHAILELIAGNLEEAVVHLTTALENDPDDEWTLFTRGAVYDELGQDEKARADHDALRRLQRRAVNEQEGPERFARN